MKKLLYFGVLVFILISCSGNYKEIDNLEWISGNWKSKVQGNDMFETWAKTDDSTWTGTSRFEKDGKLLFSEKMTITKRLGIVSFTSVSNEQNNGNAVQFNAKTISDNKVVFENLAHDFPKRIVYQAKPNGKLLAYIEGNSNGTKNRIEFPMRKLK